MGERANRREASFGHGLTPINTDSRGCFAPTDTGAKSLLYRRKSARLMSGSRAVILPLIGVYRWLSFAVFRPADVRMGSQLLGSKLPASSTYPQNAASWEKFFASRGEGVHFTDATKIRSTPTEP